MDSTATNFRFLERDLKSSYRQLAVKGTRIKASTLFGLHVNTENPRSISNIATDYGIPLDAVEEAISYCRSNPPELEDDLRRENELAEAVGENEVDYRLNPQPHVRTDRSESRRRAQ